MLKQKIIMALALFILVAPPGLWARKIGAGLEDFLCDRMGCRGACSQGCGDGMGAGANSCNPGQNCGSGMSSDAAVAVVAVVAVVFVAYVAYNAICNNCDMAPAPPHARKRPLKKNSYPELPNTEDLDLLPARP